MVEAAASNTFIISSDCPSGPREFLDQDAGLLFENNNSQDLRKKSLRYEHVSPKIKQFKLMQKTPINILNSTL